MISLHLKHLIGHLVGLFSLTHLMKGLVSLGHVLGKYMVKYGRTKMEHPYKKGLISKELAQEIYMKKSYLRDNTSFYDNKEFFWRYHLPGDANLRAFGNQGFSGVEQVFAITFEGFLSKSFAGVNFELAGFIDQGTLSGSKFAVGDKGFNNSTLVDYGIGLRISTAIFGQPIYLRFDKPLEC